MVPSILSKGIIVKIILALAVLLGTLVFAAPASATDPTRVMPVGDSVTHGKDGDHTWRYFAWKTLADVDFVGPQTGTHAGWDDYFGGEYADTNFDQDHAAVWGAALEGTIPVLEGWVREYQPEIVVDALGVNDIVWPGQSGQWATTEDVIERQRVFVATARAGRADVDVLLVPLPQVWRAEVVAYNAALPALAAELTTDTSRVVVAPLAQWVEGVDTYDPLHPNARGDRSLAYAVVEGLSALGLLTRNDFPTTEVPIPEPTPAVTPEPAPTPVVVKNPPVRPRKVRASAKGQKVRISWRKTTGAEWYNVRCGDARRSVKGNRVRVRSAAKRCVVRAGNGDGHSAPVRVKVRRR